MRKVITLWSFLLISILLYPIATAIMTEKTLVIPETKNDAIEQEFRENVIAEALTIVKNDYCDESLKAILAIINNNSIATSNPTISDVDKSSAQYKKLESLYTESNISIKYKDLTVYIPMSTLSSGFTKTSEKYPYLKSVASPWDCRHKDFVYKKDYSIGISIEGINYLCDEGLDAREALSWYLPDFEIK